MSKNTYSRKGEYLYPEKDAWKAEKIEAQLSPLVAMDDQQQAELQYHLGAISAILYAEADPAELTTLEGIEKNVRNLAQEYVLPQLGIFLSTARPAAAQVSNEL